MASPVNFVKAMRGAIWEAAGPGICAAQVGHCVYAGQPVWAVIFAVGYFVLTTQGIALYELRGINKGWRDAMAEYKWLEVLHAKAI